MKQQNNKETEQYIRWKSRRSELSGYKKMYYMNTEDGDYLRADSSSGNDTVRLYVELESDGGAGYISIIKDGKITVEKSSISNKFGNFSDKFSSKSDMFSTLPDVSFIKIIGGNYGITAKKSTADRLKETRRKYFKETQVKIFRQEEVYVPKSTSRRVQIGLIDLLDFLIGVTLSFAVFLAFNYNFIAMGITSAAFGILIGTIDIFVRKKELVATKMVIFILAGAIFYVYGHFVVYF